MWKRGAIAVMAVIVVAGCGNPTDDPAHMFYGPTNPVTNPPALVDIQTTYSVPQNDYIDCAFGVTGVGVGVLVAAAVPIPGVDAWVGFAVTTAAGAGPAIKTCLDNYNANTTYFSDWFYCTNLPLLRTSPDYYFDGGYSPYVEYDGCHCSMLCMQGQYTATAAWLTSVNYYHDGANHVYGASSAPPDWNALATSMNLTYGGCTDYYDHVSQCPGS